MAGRINVDTDRRVEVVDITDGVAEEVKRSEVENGACTVFVSHTTAGVTVNENESGLVDDIHDKLSELVPENDGYAHDRIDNNADSHLRSLLLSSSVSVPVEDGDLVLGTWQSVLLFEGDGPRNRTVVVETVGE